MFQVTSLSGAILILHCVFCSEVKRENVTDILSAEDIPDSRLEASRCVTSYESVEQVVHDTVYQHQCHVYHVSRCNVTHVTSFKDTSETRCTPGQSQSQSWITIDDSAMIHSLFCVHPLGKGSIKIFKKSMEFSTLSGGTLPPSKSME